MFHTRLKKLREEQGLSQEQFATILKFSQTTVSHWESGHREPDIKTIKKISDFFHVSADYLLGKDDCPLAKESISLSDDTEISIFRALQNLTPENKEEVLRFIQFIRSKQE